MSARIKGSCSLIFNFAIVLMFIYSVGRFFVDGGFDLMDIKYWSGFTLFAVVANILAAAASGATLIYELRLQGEGEFDLPIRLICLKFAATSAVSLTLLTLLTLVGPAEGFAPMLEGAKLCLNLLCPVFAILTLVLFDNRRDIRFVHALCGMLPTLFFGVWHFVMAAVLGCLPDTYSLYEGSNRYITALVILGATLLICLALHRAYRFFRSFHKY